MMLTSDTKEILHRSRLRIAEGDKVTPNLLIDPPEVIKSKGDKDDKLMASLNLSHIHNRRCRRSG